MPNIRHFEVLADDVERARAFYERAFGWRCNTWGNQPNFYQVRTGPPDDPGILGAIAERRDIGGRRLMAYVCTIAIDDIDAAISRIKAAGGAVLSEKYHIPNVGWHIHFADTEGNVAAAMQYEQ